MVTNELSIISPGQYVATAKRWWWVLALVPLLAAGSAYWFSLRQPPIYTASATLFISNASPSPSDVTAAKLLTKSYRELVVSSPVLERVIANLHLSRSIAQLESQIHTSDVLDTQIIKISVQDNDPQLAADITNMLGQVFMDWIAAQQQITSSQSSASLQQSIEQAKADVEKASVDLVTQQNKPGPKTAPNAAQIANLETILSQYQSKYAGLLALQQRVEFTPQNRVILTTPAEPPQTADSPRPVRDAALSFALGLALAAAGVILFERATDRVRSPDDIHRQLELSVLGAIPLSRGKAGVEIIAAPHSLMSEAIRSLRATLQFATKGRKIGVVIITSPNSNEGKSVIASNLAVALAQAGQQVVLVDGDLRRPRQHELFGKPNQNGLTQLLADPTLEVSTTLFNDSVDRLQMLVAGEIANNPSEALSGERLHEIVDYLRTVADVIVIDTPPVLVAPDALLLATVADYAIIVAQADQTRSDALRTALASIKQTSANVLGIVLNGVTATHAAYVYMPNPALPDVSTKNRRSRRASTTQRD
jgi:capsular exopolysaccharide synthesis family protein